MRLTLSDEKLRDQIQIIRSVRIADVNAGDLPYQYVFRHENVVCQKDLVFRNGQDGVEQDVDLCVDAVTGLIDPHAFKRCDEITANR